MKKTNPLISRLKNVRETILAYLDATNWKWSAGVSEVLDLVDNKLQEEKDK